MRDPQGKSNVFAVDLRRASELAKISYDELISGIHTEEAVRMQGILMEMDVNEDEGGVDGKLDALVLTSSRKTAFGIPLCLQQLQGKTIIEHSLSQLLLAGIDRVVVAVPSGSEIRAHLEKSILYSRMNMVFLEIFDNVLASIPETVLAARHLFGGHFLIHAADRVFDKALLLRFDALHRKTNSVCLLVESNMTTAARMDPSTVRVQFPQGSFEDGFKLHVGRDIPEYNGVDTGLYVVSSKVFLVLDNLIHGVGSLSLAESLTFGFHRVAYMAVDEQLWFGVETVQEMLYAAESRIISRFTPYDFTKSPAVPTKRRKSVVLSVGCSLDADDSIPRRRSSRSDKIESFEGFVVDVHKKSSASETQPLLQPLSIKIQECVLPGEVTLSKSLPDEYTLAIPLAAQAIPENEDIERTKVSIHPATHLSPKKSAYLIQHNVDSQFVLAVPDDTQPTRQSNIFRRLSNLPSDVKDVTVEAAVVEGRVEMQLTVRKQVPIVGYAILVLALLSVSSQGAALQTLSDVSPLLKMVWRYFGSSCLLGCFVMTTYMENGLPSVPMNIWGESLVCVLSYVVFCATFIWALDHTSVGHAYIFSNSHSIILVFCKCTMGQSIALLEAIGAVLGIAGGVLTSSDHSRNMNDPHSPTFEGDLVAFLGAVGGVVYLTYAKKLKELLGIWYFCFFLFSATWITMLPLLYAFGVDFELSSDARIGFFGWVNHLGVEIVLVVLVSTCGTMGFVSALKYFPPLVVSVTMLLEPVVATVICLLFGLASLPGAMTFIGGAGVIVGTFLVIYSTSHTTEAVNVSDAMVHTDGGLQEAPKNSPKSTATFRTNYGSCS